MAKLRGNFDISCLTNDEIDSMDLCHEAKATIKRIRNKRQRHHSKQSKDANRSYVEEYISTSESDLSGVTDEQIDSLGLTPMARAEVMRIVQNHRQGYNH